MKVSLRQLKRVVTQLEKECLYGDNSYDDVEVDLDITDADPGNGKIVDVLNMKATSSDQNKERNSFLSEDVEVQLFPKEDKAEPIITVKVTKKLTR